MLTFHIISGSFLLLFGIGALSFVKGSMWHRRSGNLFFLFMILMTGSAALLNNGFTMPLLTFYYGITAWAVVLRKENSTGILEILAMLLIAYISVDLFYYVFTSTAISPTFKAIFTIHATIAAMAAFLDLNMILRGGLCGKHRIARHAWRTCYALLGTVMSISANTSDSWPDFIHDDALIYLMIGILFYWLIRVLFTRWYIQLKEVKGGSLLTRRFIAARHALKED